MHLGNFFSGNGNIAEWATAVVALFAVVLSAMALGASRRLARNANFFAIHDKLMSAEAQRGRRLLFEKYESGAKWSVHYKRHTDEFESINYALGCYQTLAHYTRLGYISKTRVKQIWGGRLKRKWEAVESFIQWRREHSEYPELFDNLVWLARRVGAPVAQADESGGWRSVRAFVRRRIAQVRGVLRAMWTRGRQ